LTIPIQVNERLSIGTSFANFVTPPGAGNGPAIYFGSGINTEASDFVFEGDETGGSATLGDFVFVNIGSSSSDKRLANMVVSTGTANNDGIMSFGIFNHNSTVVPQEVLSYGIVNLTNAVTLISGPTNSLIIGTSGASLFLPNGYQCVVSNAWNTNMAFYTNNCPNFGLVLNVRSNDSMVNIYVSNGVAYPFYQTSAGGGILAMGAVPKTFVAGLGLLGIFAMVASFKRRKL
jgi:hypothetical protein